MPHQLRQKTMNCSFFGTNATLDKADCGKEYADQEKRLILPLQEDNSHKVKQKRQQKKKNVRVDHYGTRQIKMIKEEETKRKRKQSR